jgi:hypothetical protein
MWPRFVELGIGFWLLASPWVLGQASGGLDLHRFVGGAAIIALSLVSHWRPLRRAHLVEIPIAAWILGVAFFTTVHPAPAVVQSDILAALFLLNFAIIPSSANLPPCSWRRFAS